MTFKKMYFFWVQADLLQVNKKTYYPCYSNFMILKISFLDLNVKLLFIMHIH